jgi:small subunit ribosomal protein S8
MLTRIRNAAAVRKAELRVPYSNLKFAVAKILSEEGYIGSIDKANSGHGEIRISLKYEGNQPVFRSIRRSSRPGKRMYAGFDELPVVLSDRGIAVVSTSQGVMSNKEARKRKLGGEVLCEIY